MNVPDWSLVFFIVWGTTIGPLLVVFWLQKSGLLAKWSERIKEETVETVREELPSFVEDIKGEMPNIDDIIDEKGEEFLDKILDPKNEKMREKIATLGITLINPLLMALQNPDDAEGQRILHNLILNAFRRIKENPDIKRSILWFLKENAEVFIKTIVEEASRNPQFLEELMKAFMASRQEAMSGGSGAPPIDIGKEGIVGTVMKVAKIVEEIQKTGMF